MFPLCERMRETEPSFLYSTAVVWGGRDIADFGSGNAADSIFDSESSVIDVGEKERPRSQASHGIRSRRTSHVQ